MNSLYDIFAITLFLIGTLIVGFFVIYSIIRLFALIFLGSKKLKFIKKKNTAVVVFMLSVLLSFVVFASGIIEVSMHSVQMSELLEGSARGGFLARVFLMVLLQLVLTMLLVMLISFIAAKIFDFLTPKIKEFVEIKKEKNLAAGLLLAGIVMTLSLLVRPLFHELVQILIPFPMIG